MPPLKSQISNYLLLPFLLLFLAAAPLSPGSEPQLASSPTTTYLTFANNSQILFSSAPTGQPFSPPTPVATLPKLMLGMRRGPHISLSSDNTIIITAISSADGNLLAYRSTNAGHSFSDPITINDADHAAREGLHSLAAGPDRRLYAVWLDLRTGHTRLQGSLSRDAGLTWEPNDLIYESPAGHVCECCQPSATFLDPTHVAVLFRNFLDSNRDMYLATFSPGSIPQTGISLQKLGSSSWPLNSCPMDGGSLATDPATHQPTAIWTRDGHLFLTPPNNPTTEIEIAKGTQPQLLPTLNGPHLVWTTSRAGQLFYLPPNATTPIELAPKATDPVLTTTLCAYSADNHIYITPLPTLTLTPSGVTLPDAGPPDAKQP